VLKHKGKVMGRDTLTMKRGKGKTAVVALNKRGRRALDEGDRVKVQVLSKDKQGNGWRSAKTARLG
jgi:hypothetical protein